MIWALIITLLGGTPVNLRVHFEDYPSKQECLIAAADVAKQFEHIGGVKATCLPATEVGKVDITIKRSIRYD